MRRLHMVGVMQDFGCHPLLRLSSRARPLDVMPDPTPGCHAGPDPWLSSRARPLDVMPDPIRHPWIAGAATPDLIGGFIDSPGHPQ